MKGEPLAPAEIEQKLARRFRLLGTQGLVGIALAAIDMALWDALARSHGVSLVPPARRHRRSRSRPTARSATTAPMRSAQVAEDWARRGFTGVKAKIGYPTVREDVAVIRAMRSAVGDDVAIMVDYNQCLTPAEAVQRMRVLDGEGLTWVEEPTLAHDYAGHALVAREAATPIQCGENWWGTLDMQHAIDARGVGLRDARRDEDRRRHRLAARRGAGAGEEHPHVEPPVAGDLGAAALRHADRALARVRGLVESDPATSRCHRERAWPTSAGRRAPAWRGTSRPWRRYAV